MERAAEHRDDGDAEVASLVREHVHEHGAIVGHSAGCELFGHESLERSRRRVVERTLRLEPFRKISARQPTYALRDKRPQSRAELRVVSEAFSLPERELRLFHPRRRHDDAVRPQIDDLPAPRAEDKRVADPPLEHELLVEFA